MGLKHWKRAIGAALAGLVCAAGLATPGMAEEPLKLKMVLNWKYGGGQGMFFLAQDRGYFKAENLDITIDQGNGSGAAVPLVANGTYDIGFGDINALIDFAAKHPGDPPLGVYVMFNEPPFTVAVKADGPIKSPKDFEGRTLGAPVNDGALKLFPAFCKIVKIDCTKVAITNMQPNLREQMLMQGQIDGAFGYHDTILLSAKKMGVDVDKQIRWIEYSQYGMDLYSNGIIVSKALAKDHPEAVKGFLRALNHGMIDALADPKAAVDSALKREPLLNADFERGGFDLMLKDSMNSPEIARIGLGNVDPERLKRSIDILVDAYQLPRTPAVDEIFSPAFLPPVADLPKKVF
jgi:NitT/TauT family transport system substrate-binding protein